LGQSVPSPNSFIAGPLKGRCWKIEAALKCRSCKKGRYAPLVYVIKLTATQEITPYKIRMRRGEAAALVGRTASVSI
jgi:hypothetical protein